MLRRHLADTNVGLLETRGCGIKYSAQVTNGKDAVQIEERQIEVWTNEDVTNK